VLAAGTVGTPQLLMLSGIGRRIIWKTLVSRWLRTCPVSADGFLNLLVGGAALAARHAVGVEQA
jgi:hypothetical protein